MYPREVTKAECATDTLEYNWWDAPVLDTTGDQRSCSDGNTTRCAAMGLAARAIVRGVDISYNLNR